MGDRVDYMEHISYFDRERYFAFCKKLKKIAFRELMWYGDPKKEKCIYDDCDFLSQDVFEPMFDSIIDGLLEGLSAVDMEKLIFQLCSSYGIGKKENVKRLVSCLILERKKLCDLYQKAKAEQCRYKKAEVLNKQQKKLSDELDEYLRIGEGLEKQKKADLQGT